MPRVLDRPFVPWTVDVVRPLVERATDLLEKWDGETLLAEARKVSQRVADFIASRVKWDAGAKGLLNEGLSECAVKYLNLTKVSAEYLPENKTGLAALSILHSRSELISQLRAMAAEEKEKPKPAEEKKAA